jgi:UDP-GlcNAc:undecaprenyl-phosphate GlcNAc-1-phosphate transferase
VGGVPILLACAGAFLVLFLFPSWGGSIAVEGLPLVWKLLPALGLVFLAGLLDDLVGLRPWQKLALEVAASGWMWWIGVRVQGVGGYHVDQWWSLPLTVAWFIVCTNALNLIDGVDGLAAGVGLFATATTLVAALLQNNVPLAMAVVPLAGALLGFLRYNFNPASIFLGDCGSLSLGFLLGCYGVVWSQKSATLLGMTAPLMVLAIPLLDVCLSIVRRFLRGQPVFQGDRGHVHHRLLDRGLTQRRVVLVLYGMCGLFAGLSLLQTMARSQYTGLVIVLFCVVAWIGVQNLGYVEFRVARRMLLGGVFQKMIDGQVVLRGFEQRLAAAESVEECWQALADAGRELGFHEVELRVVGRSFSERLEEMNGRGTWDLRVPLGGEDYVHLTREFENGTQNSVVIPFVETLRARFRSKEFPKVAGADR